jgi:peptidoglycan/LPS O-acetylase OafA/YrhL
MSRRLVIEFLPANSFETHLTTATHTNTTTLDKSSGSTRLRGIDALRGAAALAVVLYHAIGQTQPPGSHWLARLFVQPAREAVAYGYTGVFLFFVISGFCIHLNQAKARAEGRAPRIEFFSFWRRRVRRLYPPYLVALAIYLVVAYATGYLPLDKFFVWNLASHVLMIHNFDPRTCYSINSVFWTLAIEEQLYLAYFLLLFLRRRFEWKTTLAICFAARIVCFAVLTLLRRAAGIEIQIPEAALSHWFTWALGALAVEHAFGLVRLPRWTRDLRVGAILLLAAATLTRVLPVYESYTVPHDAGWLLLHPLWGLGFFVVVNCAVEAERSWRASRKLPRAVAVLSSVGIFSYSLYLTHQLVLLEAWRFEHLPVHAMIVALLLMTPLCIGFAWLFFQLFERPFLARAASVASRSRERRIAPRTVFVAPSSTVARAPQREERASAVAHEGAL